MNASEIRRQIDRLREHLVVICDIAQRNSIVEGGEAAKQLDELRWAREQTQHILNIFDKYFRERIDALGKEGREGIVDKGLVGERGPELLMPKKETAPQWEYLDVELNESDERSFDEKLNELGSEGWELVSILWSPERRWQARFFFKRAKAS